MNEAIPVLPLDYASAPAGRDPLRALLPWPYWLVTMALFGGTSAMLIWYTPTEATMGPIQKIFYLHLPVAINTFVACLVCFVASIGYLLVRQAWLDDLASSAAKVGVLLCSIVLLTGMVWGKSAWGQWWTWSPRLTFSLVLWLLYVVYLLIRGAFESGQSRAVISAVYGVVAFLDVPLVYLSARLMPDIHPSSIQLDKSMKVTLGMWFVPVTMMSIGLIVTAYQITVASRLTRKAAEARPHQPMKLGMIGEIA